MSRRQAREELFKLVFESELKSESTKEVFESYLERIKDQKRTEEENLELKIEEIETENLEASKAEDLNEENPNVQEIILGGNDLKFVEKYMTGITEHNEEILEAINNNIVGWTFERIGTVEKSLLKTTVYELMFEDTPYEIAINEAIELAKLYGDDKTAEFVNGVLAKIIKNIKK
ncbi:transcription antitermination factor NusB [Fusobacterium sp.]|uniref:transcription antitermination factor NusB n=1 Tax=Fusobacterium sp. TaxID=68766 RepID=UPI00396CF840